MSCDQCLGLERVFGERMARADLRRYRKRGPSRTTRALIGALVREGIEGADLLDIGGGVGAIPFALLEAGAGSARLVDASGAYLAVACQEAERLGRLEKLTWRQGDFVMMAGEERAAEVVTLDRVICCYDDMRALVSASASKAERLYGLVYPRDTWWNRAGSRVLNFLLSFTRLGYRSFVHPGSEVERLLKTHGLRRLFLRDVGLWRVAVYQRGGTS